MTKVQIDKAISKLGEERKEMNLSPKRRLEIGIELIRKSLAEEQNAPIRGTVFSDFYRDGRISGLKTALIFLAEEDTLRKAGQQGGLDNGKEDTDRSQ